LTRTISSLIATGDRLSESVWVRAGVIYAVPLIITADDCSPQVNVTWEFSTEPKVSNFIIFKEEKNTNKIQSYSGLLRLFTYYYIPVAE
jgi:hypothetical protein